MCPHCGEPGANFQTIGIRKREGFMKKPMSGLRIFAWTVGGIVGLIFVGLAVLGAVVSPPKPKVAAPATQRVASTPVAAAKPPAPTATPFQPQLSNSQRELIQRMQNEGVLRLDVQRKAAHIDPLFWMAIDAQQKENVTVLLATHGADQDETGYEAIDIYDKQSARKLASYGPFQGFKVY